MQTRTTLEDALALMRDLRARCEWDAAQTHASLRPYLLEEAHELDDALRAGVDSKVREELADVLLQVLFHPLSPRSEGRSRRKGVAGALVTKMRASTRTVRRRERGSWEHMKGGEA